MSILSSRIALIALMAGVPIVHGLDHLEEHTTVGDIDGRTTQFLIEGGVVQQIQVLQQQQTGCLIVGIECQQTSEFVERLLVHFFRMIYQIGELHLMVDG